MRSIVLLFLLCLSALPTSAAALRPVDGDLLFVTAAGTGLSGAINDATARKDGPSFDHVAMVASDAGTQVALHADSEGSRQQTLATFLADARAKQRQVHVYRLVPTQRGAIADAIVQARSMLGKPYNKTYVQDDDSYYCSDFIERAFRRHHVFATQPMNFANPRTGEISAYWIAFYRERGMAVPQGLPGTNPNDMARAPVLRYIGMLAQDHAGTH